MNISNETYLKMKQLIADYEAGNKDKDAKEKPYLTTVTLELDRKYNKDYGNDRICKCGHPYYRHFDTYEQMEAVGCKYCQCYGFEEKQS